MTPLQPAHCRLQLAGQILMRYLPIRQLIQYGVGLLVAGLFFHTWLAIGLIAPVVVSGSSMAPTLTGPHHWCRCDECGYEFSLGVDEMAPDGQVACSRCRRWTAWAVDNVVRPGDRLIIDRTAYVFRDPRRWEVVVFRSPADANKLWIKRVVGLPGERVSLSGGDVRINGRPVPKPGQLEDKYVVRYGDRPQQLANAAENPRELTGSWQLGPSEFFVIGDNAAISDDSRNWIAGGLDARLLVGKPLGVR